MSMRGEMRRDKGLPCRDHNLFSSAGCSNTVCKEEEEGTDDGQDLNFGIPEKREDGGHVNVAAAEHVTRRAAMKD